LHIKAGDFSCHRRLGQRRGQRWQPHR
jgi:hypothetical protein